MTDVMVAKGLAKSFGDLVAVDGVGFTIGEGETYGLLGPNGAGKTTTISMIAGLLEADQGEVRVGGELISPKSVAPKRRMGLVPQELAIYPDLTARENLDFFGRLYGMGGAELAQRAERVLAVVGLDGRQKDLTKEFSGGMKRRLNIGIGLLHNPELLILDEPTVGVDPQSRNAILEAVEELSSAGIAVLYTTHYMEEAERLCDRVGIIDQGRIIAEGTRRQLVDLVGEKDRVTIAGTGSLAEVVRRLSSAEGVAEAGESESGVTLLVEDSSAHLAAILSRATDAGMAVSGVEIEQPDLEAVFLHLTGKALRDV
ncbi:MAG TPA: ABC transporter ATP-binding protein [Acidimicrobiia bacterium]|nr:ABC transporter ATP-binding protein [Acidimicrobiia bacterium]